MKKIILLWLITVSGLATAQIDSSLHEDFDELKMKVSELIYAKQKQDAKIETIKLNLDRSHKIYKVGVGLQVVGIGCGVSALIYSRSNPISDIPTLLFGASLAFGITGTIAIWHSHKYIGKAGE